jgi:hypothetical protein
VQSVTNCQLDQSHPQRTQGVIQINETRIENLGTGVVYCMLINHFHPNAIHPSKITQNPRSHHEYRANLRRVQEGLASLDLKHISFDVSIP